jgi:Rrf2 family transcriptional regulator, nitric oxide-sensitive transcriptional repressor
MVLLAMRHGSPQTAQQIAAETKVPIDYLFKVLQSLGRAGLAQAQRGKHGGYHLTGDPADISIFDVVQAVEPMKRIQKCPLGLRTHGVMLCPLHRKLDDAMRQIEEAFSSTRLADLIDEPGSVRPLCEGDLLSAGDIKHSAEGRGSHAKPL